MRSAIGSDESRRRRWLAFEVRGPELRQAAEAAMQFDFNMTLEHPRMRHIVRNAVRWHLTGFDAMNGRGMDADGVDEHGWSASERERITEIMAEPAKLAACSLVYCHGPGSAGASQQRNHSRNSHGSYGRGRG